MTFPEITTAGSDADQGQRGDILMLCHRIPYPPDKGDKIRSYNFLMHLLHSGWRVHLGALVDEPGDLEHAKVLQRLCASVKLVSVSPLLKKIIGVTGVFRGRAMSVEYFRNTSLQKWVDERCKALQLHAVLCVCAPMAEYVFRNARLSQAESFADRSEDRMPLLLMDFMDVDSEKWRDYAASSTFPMSSVYGLEAWLLRRYEQKIAELFHHVLLVSDEEATLFRERVSVKGHVSGLSNGVDLETFAAMPPVRNRRMFFCGAMDYLPNIDAVEWFVQSVFPRIRKKIPDAEFVIVGSKPSSRVRQLGDVEGVTVTGKVPDVRPYAREAALCVVPLRIARGLQNKVLEAMAMGRAVVATPEAVTGIAGKATRDFVVARADAGAFADAALTLLRNPGHAEAIAEHGRRLVEDKYRWAACLKQLDILLQQQSADSPVVSPVHSLPASEIGNNDA